MPYPDGGEIYRINSGAFGNTYALDRTFMQDEDTQNVPSQEEVLASWDSVIRADGLVYKKSTSMLAMEALDNGVLETIVGGSIETRSEYEAGDMIMCGPEGERYTMKASEFAVRYDRSCPTPAVDPVLADEGFQLYQSTNRIWALEITASQVATYFPEGQFIAAWGSPITVEAGDFLAMPHPNGGEVYRIKSNAFSTSYSRAE